MPIFDDILKKNQLTEGVYTIQNGRGKMLCLKRLGDGYGVTLKDDVQDASKFRLIHTGDNVWEIRPLEVDGYCLDVRYCSSQDGAPLIIYPENGTSAQRFKIEKSGLGYRIKTAASSYGKYVSVTGDGVNVIQSSESGDGSMWVFSA